MFGRVRRRTIQWRRVAQFEPVRVEGARPVEDEGADRPSETTTARPGLRVVLRREPRNADDLNAVAVESFDEQTLGYLPAEVAAWVAPLLDSGRVTFDGRIYAMAPADEGLGSFYLSLTQFELKPVERSSLVLAIRALVSLPVIGANWCLRRAAALVHAVSPTLGSTSDEARMTKE
jgi:HIRAN domain